MKLFTLPNLITLGNLVCGFLGIFSIFNSDFKTASLYIFLALILDFLDGFVARMLKISSDIGQQLDSLADVITFGLLPSIMIFRLIDIYGGGDLKYISILIALFSALRLAKFNVDKRQSDLFIGLPTPANAMLISTFPFLIAENNWVSDILKNPAFLVAYVLIFSYLLIMELPLFALKFKNFSWSKNRIKYLFLILSVFLLLILKFLAVPLIIILYILISLMGHLKIINI